MDKWLIPGGIILVVMPFFFRWLLVVYGILMLLWGYTVWYNGNVRPGPCLSLLVSPGLRVLWYTKGDRRGYILIIAEGDVIKKINPDREVKNPLGSKFSILSASIIELEPGKNYSYQIVETIDEKTEKVVYRGSPIRFTFPAENLIPAKPTRIVAFGDMQPKRFMPPILQALIMQKIKRSRPELVIYMGDHTNTGNDLRAWLWHTRLISVVGSRTPVLGTPGNHDRMQKRQDIDVGGIDAYKAFTHYPGNQCYYGTLFNDIHVISLDFHEPLDPNNQQLIFLQNELAPPRHEPGCFTILFSHATPYHTAIKPTNIPRYVKEMREHVIPLISRSNVIWLGGHEHAYQKFTVDGIHYITTAATSSFHDHDYFHDHMDLNVKKFHYVMIDVDGAKMEIKAIPVIGKTIDSFAITREKDRT